MACRHLASADPFMPFICQVRVGGRRSLRWWEEVEAWLDGAEAEGYYYVDTGRMRQSEWVIRFTHENTAFAFKMRFG